MKFEFTTRAFEMPTRSRTKKRGLPAAGENWIRRIAVLIAATMVAVATGYAGEGMARWEQAPDSEGSDTLLMFVGEDLEVLTIATGREESARKVPAVATVITREQIRNRGDLSVSDALSRVPGVYMAQKEWGELPYMRGISNSVLVLHDTVPMGSDVTKNLNALDYGTSLSGVKRIEIVSGPGSVLWGPDAFAGIVNIVPMSGKDFSGVESGLSYGAPDEQVAGYLNMGHAALNWDSFLSISARKGEDGRRTYNLLQFWGSQEIPVSPKERYGSGTAEPNQYLEATGQINLGEGINISGRVSEARKNYVMGELNEPLTWRETRNIDSGYFKVEMARELDSVSALRVNGSVSWLNSDYEIVDFSISQREKAYYGEMLYDRRMFRSKGLLTAGASYRKKEIDDAPVWDGYVPEYFSDDNTTLLPRVTLSDYDTGLFSIFGQYTHKLRNMDVLLSLRYDSHDSYKETVSYNLGAVWHPASYWVVKLLHGTAYRTPYSKQLRSKDLPNLEGIQNLSAQVIWAPGDAFSTGVTLFKNRLSDHVMEDPYAGLSEPNHQDIEGIEMKVAFMPFSTLNLTADLTVMNAGGPDEVYKYNDYSFILDDGTIENHYVDLIYPYDPGPETLLNLAAEWLPTPRLGLSVCYHLFSETYLAYPRGDSVVSVEGAGVLDLSLRIDEVFSKRTSLSMVFKNLADTAYQTPGTYDLIDGERFGVAVFFRWQY